MTDKLCGYQWLPRVCQQVICGCWSSDQHAECSPALISFRREGSLTTSLPSDKPSRLSPSVSNLYSVDFSLVCTAQVPEQGQYLLLNVLFLPCPRTFYPRRSTYNAARRKTSRFCPVIFVICLPHCKVSEPGRTTDDMRAICRLGDEIDVWAIKFLSFEEAWRLGVDLRQSRD